MAVVLADVLDERQVTLDLRARSRAEALREIISSMQGDEKVRAPEKFLTEVMAREDAQTTYMGNGVAFPHARTGLVTQIVLGIGRSRSGVAFGEKGEAAHLIFVIAVPQRMVTDYLVCVGALARLTKEEEMRRQLMDAATPSELAELLREGSLLLE